MKQNLEESKEKMMSLVEKYLDKILTSKNWNNILLREQIRNDIIFNFEKIDEKQITNYLNLLSDEQLNELRERIFKLARDHYIEHLLKKFCKPLLKPVNTKVSNKYMLKCNLIRDSLDCLYYIIDPNLSLNIPKRCTEFEQFNNFKFPLGKQNLKDQLMAIKTFRAKLIKHHAKLNSLKQMTHNIGSLEKSLTDAREKIKLIRNENQFLRGCLTIILVVFIIFIILFLFFFCLEQKCSKI